MGWRGLLGGLGQPASRGEFLRKPPDEAHEDADDCGHARPGLAELRIEIRRAAHFHLQGVEPARGGGVAIEPVAARVRPVVRGTAAGRGEVLEGGGTQRRVA